MAKKEQLIVGVDIGSHAVKVCQLQHLGKGYRLLALGSASIPHGAVEDGVLHEPEEVGKVISSLLKNLKIKHQKIGISISGYSVIVKKIRLDDMEDDDLAKYIESEAEQYIPFDIEDVYLDFQRLPGKKDKNDRIEVMLVAAKREVVDNYLNMLREQKLNPVLVDVDGFALENIWETVDEEKKNIALVDIGSSKMNINIISGGSSVLARDIIVGSEQITEQISNTLAIEPDEAEQLKLGLIQPTEKQSKILEEIFTRTCTQWVLEIKKAIDLYNSNYPEQPLLNLALSGGGSKVNGLREFLENETKLQVIPFNPFVKMVINEKKIDRNYLNAIAPEMAIAAGLAIRPATI